MRIAIAGAGIDAASSHDKGRIRCRCDGAIRLTSPHYSRHFHHREASCEIWGVGEAIGCVAPLAGDGIVPGMKSARILVQYWDDPVGYRKAVLKEFRWMKSEREVIEKLRNSRHPGLFDAVVLKNNSRRMGIRVKFNQAIGLLRHLK